jgi:hypothetical protein
MFLILFFIVLLAWLFGWAAFQVARGSIHLLGILASVSLMRGRRIPNWNAPGSAEWREMARETGHRRLQTYGDVGIVGLVMIILALLYLSGGLSLPH